MKKLSEYVDCNPTVKLKKGNHYTLVDIDSIEIGRKYSGDKGTVEYTGQGGSKFSDGDTIMARITPCLENGKLAQYRGATDAIGSTELFVFRAKKGISSADFVYYFMKQAHVRNYAANSMTGASGRQRADIGFIKKLKCNFPQIEKQERIASILSSYDELIENNNRRIKILEQMAENLYKEWFVRFRFPGHEQTEFENGIPKGWETCKLREIIRIRYGKDHKDLEDGTIPVFGSGGVMRYGNRALYSGETVMIPRKGSLHNVTYYKGDLWTVDTMFYTEFKVPTCASYSYFTLSQFDLESLNKGASIPSLSTDILYNLKIVLPPQWLLTQFQQMIDVLNAQTEKLTQQNHNLTKQRDMLLPRLMSGKLEV